VTDLDDGGAAFDRGCKWLTGKVGDDQPVVGDEVSGEAPVDVGGEDRFGYTGTAEHAHGRVEAFDERGTVELIDLVTGEAGRGHGPDPDTFTAAPVIDVGAVHAGRFHRPQPQRLRLEQATYDPTGLPTEGDTEDDVDAQLADQPGDPEYLPARVEVHLRVAGTAGSFQGNGQQR